MALLSILDRFRPVGAPGPAGPVGVPPTDDQGPAAELAPAVGRQRAALQYLLETLVAAQPQALLAVQRERPLPTARVSELKR